jgi:hypothetical protein
LKLYDLVTFKTSPDIIGQIVGYQVLGDYSQTVVKYRDAEGFVTSPFDEAELELFIGDVKAIGFSAE